MRSSSAVALDDQMFFASCDEMALAGFFKFNFWDAPTSQLGLEEEYYISINTMIKRIINLECTSTNSSDFVVLVLTNPDNINFSCTSSSLTPAAAGT